MVWPFQLLQLSLYGTVWLFQLLQLSLYEMVWPFQLLQLSLYEPVWSFQLPFHTYWRNLFQQFLRLFLQTSCTLCQ
jgi:hypothetical protein